MKRVLLAVVALSVLAMAPLAAQVPVVPPPVARVVPGLSGQICPLAPNSLLTCALFTSTTAVSNVSTTETDLITYSLPANTLSANGQAVRITAYFTTANNANNKTLRLYFGATLLYDSGAVAFANRSHKIEAMVIRTGATAQAGAGTYVDSSGSVGMRAWSTPAETLSGAVTIKGTGTSGTASSDVTQVAMVVEWVP